MPKSINLLLALIAGNGWHWARIAESNSWINGTQALVGSFVLTGFFLVHQLLILKPKPANRESAQQRSGVVNALLETLITEYYSVIKSIPGATDGAPMIRANVMVPVVDCFGLRKRLQIVYKAAPSGFQYERAELILYWGARRGVAGWVWKSGHALTYRAGAATSADIDASVPDGNKSAISDIKTIYSVPIVALDGRTIGVLSLDSPEEIAQTYFSNQQVTKLVGHYASMLPSQCFESGIKG